MDKIPEINFNKKQDRNLGFEIMTISEFQDKLKLVDHSVEELHRIRFHLLKFVSSEKSYHNVDFKTYNLNKGDLVFVIKNQIQAFDISLEQEGYLVLFTDDFVSSDFSKSDYLAFYRFFSLSQRAPIISFEEYKEIDNLFSSMHREFNGSNMFSKFDIIRSYLKIILLLSERSARKEVSLPSSVEYDLFLRFEKLLSAKFKKSRDAKIFAQELNVSYRRLNDVCKSFTSKTAKVLIDLYVILQAKRELFQLDIPIKEISYSLGFDEATNFVKFFKKHVNKSPKEFRKQFVD